MSTASAALPAVIGEEYYVTDQICLPPIVLWIHPAVVGFLLEAVVPLIHFMAFLQGVD